MTEPHVSYALLNGAGETCGAYDERREFYAASTIKLAVAAALLFAVEGGTMSLERAVPSSRRFASRIPGAAHIDFELEPDELDPGMPADGTPVSLSWCLERMLTVSSNEATNLIIEALGASSGGSEAPVGVRGLDAVREACARLGVPGVRVTRLICDAAAKRAGFTHAASALDLAQLMLAVTSGEALTQASRDLMVGLLRAQRVPIIAEVLPAGLAWGSKSGWDDEIRHDVAFIGTPGSDEFRVLAICTQGYSGRGAQQVILAVAHSLVEALHRPSARGAAPGTSASP
ncbi:serine hydrolase [Microbacterium esteraromaticum]|uniref:Serine hydrolase n=1 Tax=Microbacterium esteraromaticum TaxID=57043 RepID=A0A7D7WBQ2_9MICO|nr:serine hydrolase [Microbacterium esteraromaticum]QMU97678.1 serine hydrolase [Microbacterium esteraromaticum]